MVKEKDKEMFIKLCKTNKTKLVLEWLKDLVLQKYLTMDDVLDLMAELKK